MYRVAALAVLFVLAACGGGSDGAPIGPGPTTTLVPPVQVVVDQPVLEFQGLVAKVITDELDEPVDVAGAIGDDRLFVAEKAGVVRIVGPDGVEFPEPFLDLRGFVLDDGNEQGLTTIELHPRFVENGRVFVFYTDLDGDGQLYEYTVDESDPDRLDPDSGRQILEILQPNQYHQSGTIDFGPDGYLWLSLGDGGGQYDSYENGQDPTTLLGSILRLDVDAAEPYAIPPDNPFVDENGESAPSPEVWAFGLRNPWRISIDQAAGMLYVPDVSQEGNEEINIVPLNGGPHNFGWPVWEGTDCLDEELCNGDGFTQPLYEYPHEGTCAIVGGEVYRGASIPELHGHYFFADHCGGWIRSIVYDDGIAGENSWRDDLGRIRFITSMSTDGRGDIVITTLEGQLLRIEAVRG